MTMAGDDRTDTAHQNAGKPDAPGAVLPSSFNWARSAGLAYLAVAILAGFAQFSARAGMIVSGDTAQTLSNIAANRTLYGFAGVADLIVLLLDTWLALAFWMLLKPIDRPLALLALFLNLLRLPWMGANVVYHFAVLLLLEGALPSFPQTQIDDLASLLLDMHAFGYAANGVFFGAWCFTIGLLFYRSGFLPRILGVLMMVALVGYWTDLLVTFLAPQMADVVSPVAVLPAALAEIMVCIWLIFAGGRVHRAYLMRTGKAGSLPREKSARRFSRASAQTSATS